MATHDYVLDNATGANFRSDLNNALAAIVSNNSSSSEPSTKYAYQWWADTNDGVLKIRNSSNDGWVTLLQLDGTLTLEDGTNSAPALGFRDDLNTGIFSSAADTLDITCGGTTRGSFSSSGLTVTGNVTATTFVGNIDAVDGDFDGTLEADAITVAGVALSTVIAGTTVTTATNANHISVADNESTNENNLIPFIEDASATGNVGLESDGDFTYNPSTGTVTATKFVGETVVGDSSPQLGGTLDTNGNLITFGDSSGASDDRLKFGVGADLSIYHDATDSYIENKTNDLYIQTSGSGDDIIIKSNDDIFIQPQNGEDGIKVIGDGAVELYHNNVKRFSTESDGIKIHAGESEEAIIGLFADEGDDAADKYRIVAQDSGDLVLQRNNGSSFSSELRLGSAGGIQANFQGSAKLNTVSGGVSLTGGAAANVTALSDGSTITIDMATACHHSVTLGGNRTFAAPSNQAIGQSGSIFITQDGSGSRTASFNSAFKFVGGTAPTLTTGAGLTDRIDYIIFSSNVIHCAVSLDVK